MDSTKALRELLAREKLVVAPGAYDCATARLIEQAGFVAVYMTGAGSAAARAGMPDYGLLTMTEMVANAAAIARAVAIPVIADADTGYGNELNVARTVREYERAGVAAIHLEDQTFPKKCGHLDRKEIIPRQAFVARIRAAVEQRQDPNFVIIARTDAIAVEGFDQAIQRARAALAAGADVAFVEAPETAEQLRAVPALVEGPCLLNVVQGGKTPPVSRREAEQYGYRLAILPTMLLSAAVKACDQALAHYRETGELPPAGEGDNLKALFRRFGADEWDALRARYAAPA